MHVPRLRRPHAIGGLRGQSVALQNDHMIEAVGESLRNYGALTTSNVKIVPRHAMSLAVVAGRGGVDCWEWATRSPFASRRVLLPACSCRSHPALDPPRR